MLFTDGRRTAWRRLSPRWLAVLCVCCLSAAAAVLSACDTPVYRYAMYRWEPAVYEIYYFHDQPSGENDSKLQAAIEAAASSESDSANVAFHAVSLVEDPELKLVPPYVRQLWQSQEDAQTPSYLVLTPYGAPIHRGALDVAEFQRLIRSPARQQMLQQLSEGKAGVMLLLTGTDQAATATAENVVKDFLADVASGEVTLYSPPPGGFFQPGDESETPAAPAVEVGYVKLDRADPQEKWLVDTLLSIEEDLTSAEFVDQPMMFVGFGRGRALPPCVGKGINRENLLECVDFITGACSCTVKEQNPGMDLPMAADWVKVAEAVAARFGNEEGNEIQLATEDFFPQLIIPAGQPGDRLEPGGPMANAIAAVPAAGASVEPEPANAADPAAEDAAATAAGPSDVSGDPAAERETAGDRPAEAAGSSGERIGAAAAGKLAGGAQQAGRAAAPSAISSAAAAGSSADAIASGAPSAGAAGAVRASPAAPQVVSVTAARSSVLTGVFVVGLGLAVALVVLFGLTFLVLRPR